MIPLLFALMGTISPCENLLANMDIVQTLSDAKIELQAHAPFVSQKVMDDAILKLFKRTFLTPKTLEASEQEQDEFVTWMRRFAERQLRR